MNRKLVKLLKNPQLFFYDYFAKRVHGPGSAQHTLPSSLETAVAAIHATGTAIAPTAAPATKKRKPAAPARASSTPPALFSRIDCMLLSPRQLLQHLFGAHSGALTGMPDQSQLLRRDQLRLFIAVCVEIALFRSSGVRFYTMDGRLHLDIKPGAGASTTIENKLFLTLNETTDFVVEFPHLLGKNPAIHAFIYLPIGVGQYEIRSPLACLKKFSSGQINTLYPPASDEPIAAPGPIDVVYTWVNKDDSGWQTLWDTTFPENPCDPDRFTSSDELRYSIRSVLKYAPWIRNIYVVSNCAAPDYIDLEHERIRWVSHDEIFPDSSVLPTFNSHAIESCLHRIESLSEHFIYFNDDVFLNQPVYPLHFFDDAGRSVSYLEPYGMVTEGENDETTADYLVAARNSIALLKQDFPNYHARQLHTHVPHCLRRSTLAHLETRFAEAFARTRAARLRSETDVNITSFLYHHYALVSGSAVRGQAVSLIVRPRNIEKFLERNGHYKYRFLCFNDGGGSSTNRAYKRRFSAYCAARQPVPCEVELTIPRRNVPDTPAIPETPVIAAESSPPALEIIRSFSLDSDITREDPAVTADAPKTSLLPEKELLRDHECV